MYQKYAMGMPLYRQEKDWYQLGLNLSRSNMAHWVIRCSEEWLQPIYDRIHKQLLASHILHCDETRIQCNKEENKKASSQSFMWVLRSGKHEPFPAVLFHYSKTRGGEHAVKLLKDFESYLVTDAYAGYKKVDNIKRALCWSHVRRYYLESIPLIKGKRIKEAKGNEALVFIKKLFKIESAIAHLSKEERFKQRQEQSTKILEAYWSWVEETAKVETTNIKLIQALKYSLNQKPYLETFLEDADIPLSNNDCENAIRPLATGRRAWLFADTPKGAHATALVYSIVESAKANGLNVYQYIKYLLEVMPSTDFHNDPDLLEDYLPWSEKLPEICNLKRSSEERS